MMTDRKGSSSVLKSLSDKHHQLARFADYFVICGLDLENGLVEELYTGERTIQISTSHSTLKFTLDFFVIIFFSLFFLLRSKMELQFLHSTDLTREKRLKTTQITSRAIHLMPTVVRCSHFHRA